MIMLAASLAGLAIFGLVLALGMPSQPSALWRLAGTGDSTVARAVGSGAPFADRVVGPALDKLTDVFSSAYPARWRVRIQTRLEKAGSDIDGWYKIAAFQAGLAVLIGVAALFAGPGSGATRPLLAIVAAGLGFMIPDILLSRRIKARNHEIERALADGVDLLVVCMEAGLGFDASLAKLVEKSRGPLTQEFARALHGMWKGQSRREALQGIIERTEVRELHSVLHSVIQADRTGAALSSTLRAQTEQLRIRLRQRAEETAMKAPVKIVFPLVFLIFPALFGVILAPAAITFLDS